MMVWKITKTRVLSGFTPRNVNGNGQPINTSRHGDACSGIIAATQNNNIGIGGIAPNCNIVPINIFFGGETPADIANGINWAWNQGQGAVLSNSWYYNTSSQTQPGFDAIIQAIIMPEPKAKVEKDLSLYLFLVMAAIRMYHFLAMWMGSLR
jgi:subtilisin family serine protease